MEGEYGQNSCPLYGGISGSCRIAEGKSLTWRDRWDFAVGGRMGIRWADVSRRIEEDVVRARIKAQVRGEETERG